MLYLVGVNLPDEKYVPFALKNIYGVGLKTAQNLCHQLLIHPRCRLRDLPEEKVTQLSQVLNSMKIEAELRRETKNRILRLIDIGSYRGWRHLRGLPVRGQRTRPSGRTARRLNGKGLGLENRKGMEKRTYTTSAAAAPRPPTPPTWSLSLAKAVAPVVRFFGRARGL
ncbi:hypothetical protein HK104_006979 [Borealophlyctis nickersoniae]|nr:hypothetical protein HK104_006979 [Borealophlyctis nickersoniae]